MIRAQANRGFARGGFSVATFTDTSGNDNLTGTSSNDQFTVTNGTDSVTGAGGTDTLIIDYSVDTVGVGNNGGPSVNGTGGFDGAFTDSTTRYVGYTSIEKFQITTGSGNDNITTGSGNDIVNTGAGDDIVNVGSGTTDTANGGAGIDGLSADFSTHTSGVSINLQTGTSTGSAFTNFEYFGTIAGSAFADTFVSTTDVAASETFNLGAGNDSVTIVNGSATVNGGAGSDTLVLSFGADTLTQPLE